MVSYLNYFVNIEFVLNNSIDFFKIVIYNTIMKKKNLKENKELAFFDDAKKNMLKQSLVKKILKGVGIGLGSVSVVTVSTISVINRINRDNVGGNKDYKPPIVIPTIPNSTKEPTITITDPTGSNNTTPIENPIFANYTKSQLEDATFATQFLWNKILDDVNHNSPLISKNAQFVNFNNNLNLLNKNVEFLVEDNNKFFVITYVNKTDKEVKFDSDYLNPAESIGELTTILFENLSLSSIEELTSVDSKANESISKFITDKTKNKVVNLLGFSNAYKSSTLFESENECVDVYGYSLTDGVYKNCKITFGRSSSNYYSTTLTEDITSFAEEYNSFYKITEEQLHDLYNKYSLSHNLSDDLFIEPNTMTQLLLLIQVYEQQKTNLSTDYLVDDFIYNFNATATIENILDNKDNEEKSK